ncbi:MAG: cupredoxin domain-containing protein [Anaerolineales bacterium]
MKRYWKTLLLLLATAALLLTACGPQTAELEVTMTDFAFDPAEVSVPAGAEVTLTLTNDGSVEHNWVLMESGYTAEAPFNEQDQENVSFEASVLPDETETVTFTAPSESGTYQIVCSIEGHLEAGMEGTLIVE